jgi:hypothetical protein
VSHTFTMSRSAEVLPEHLATVCEIWIFGHKVHGPRALELCRVTI